MTIPQKREVGRIRDTKTKEGKVMSGLVSGGQLLLLMMFGTQEENEKYDT